MSWFIFIIGMLVTLICLFVLSIAMGLVWLIYIKLKNIIEKEFNKIEEDKKDVDSGDIEAE